jgi:hypothetical protein
MGSHQRISGLVGDPCDVYVRARDLKRAGETKAASTKPYWRA